MMPQLFRSLLRTLMRNKMLSAINITGLALGFASCLFILLFLFDELSFDAHHANIDRIFRIKTRFVSEGSIDHIAIAASPLPETLKEKFPEVEESIRFDMKGAGITIRKGEEIFHDDNAWASDPQVFRIFSYEFIQGDPETALARPDQVVLTASEAKKYFGTVNVLGKILNIDKRDHQVSGVIQDIPMNSDVRFSLLLPLDTANQKDWFDFSYYVYVMFRKENVLTPDFKKEFDAKLQTLADEQINARMREENVNMSATMGIQPLRGLHFDNSLTYDTPKGNRNYVYLFVAIAVLIVFIACINYINFSIVQSMEKSREVGIRKVIGSTYSQLIVRYLSQSLILTLLAMLIAVVLVVMLLPQFNTMVGRNFSVYDLGRPELTFGMLVIVLVTGVLAGSYPAVYGSSVRIVDALKGHAGKPGGQFVRKISITVQFAVTLGLLISTITIYTQMRFVRNYDLGFRKDNVVGIQTPEDSVFYQRIHNFKQELLQHSNIVKGVALAGDGGMPGDPNDEQRGSLALENENGKSDVRMVNMTYIDEDYFDVLDVRIKEGRTFTQHQLPAQGILVNEALVQAMGWKDPLSRTIRWGQRDVPVTGVVGNIYYKALYNPVEPQIFVPHEKRIVNVMVRLPSSDPAHIAGIRELWMKHFPDEVFRYRFADETIGKQYAQDETIVNILTHFSVFTIIISVFGTFGLSMLSAYQRRKEIGIRKVIGANFKDISILFCKEYLILILLALVVVSPIVWYLLNEWLATFVNHTTLQVTVFLVTGACFALFAVAFIMMSIGRIAARKSVELIQ